MCINFRYLLYFNISDEHSHIERAIEYRTIITTEYLNSKNWHQHIPLNDCSAQCSSKCTTARCCGASDNTFSYLNVHKNHNIGLSKHSCMHEINQNKTESEIQCCVERFFLFIYVLFLPFDPIEMDEGDDLAVTLHVIEGILLTPKF